MAKVLKHWIEDEIIGATGAQGETGLGTPGYTGIQGEPGATGISSGAGLVYVNDVEPQPTIGSNVGDKLWLSGSNNNVLVSCSADDPDIRVFVIAMIGRSNLRPGVTVNGTSVGNWDHTAYDSDNRVLFRGYADITIVGNVVTVQHEDGATATCLVVADPLPIISTASFVNNYPGTQTEVKSGDTFDIQVTADIDFVNIEIEDSGACSGQTTAVPSGTSSIISATIADRGNIAVLRPARVRVQKASGVWSNWLFTNTSGSVDGTDVVNCNNLRPTVSAMTQGSITYPVSQEAIKGAESVTINSLCSDFDTILYSSPNAQLTIPSDTVYAVNKASISRLTGDYNVSTVNYRIAAHRAANDSSASEDLIVYIAHVAATVVMTEPASRLRTGGNDGSTAQTHNITLTSSQKLIGTPTIAAPSIGGGTWVGVFVSGDDIVWTRGLLCDETGAVTPGTYTYQALSAFNLANIETTAYTGDTNYVVGGFVSRILTLIAFANETVFNAPVTDYTKCTLLWEVKALPTRAAFNDNTTPTVGAWSFAGTIGAYPTTARILDTAATTNRTTNSTVTVEETV